MSNDMRIVKFRMMIEEIWKTLGERSLTDNLGDLVWNDGYDAAWLAIMYDYDKLNDYGKAIMKQVCELGDDEIEDINEIEDEDIFYRVKFVKDCKDMEYRMRAAKALVVKLNEEDTDSLLSFGKTKKLHFMFWSLMILAVDDTDKEDSLSLICDFAKMLHISDLEMMDIVAVVRLVFHKKVTENITAPKVLSCFGELLKDYNYQGNPIDGAPSSVNGIMSGIIGAAWRPGTK